MPDIRFAAVAASTFLAFAIPATSSAQAQSRPMGGGLIEFLFSGTHILRQFAANYVTFLFNIGVFLNVDFLTPPDVTRREKPSPPSLSRCAIC